MPRENDNEICKQDQMNCATTIGSIWPLNQISTCDCLPSCVNIKYKIDYERTSDYSDSLPNILYHADLGLTKRK